MTYLLFGSARVSSVWADFALMILRVYVGFAMAFQHGIAKLPPAERFIEGVASLGFPWPGLFAWSAGLAEFLGGIFLALGFLTRPSALFIAITMGVAGFLTHATDPFKVKELALLYLASSLVFFFLGCGRFGIDALIRGKRPLSPVVSSDWTD